MALPQHHFQQHYPPQQQQQQSKSFRNLYTIDGQISPAVAYFDSNALQDHSQHPPYVPPFHVVGFAPGPVAATDGSDNGADFQWNYGLESKRKRPKEQDFLENNSQMSSVLQQQQSVSTGLGLSLDNNRMASTGDSALLSLIGEDVDLEIQRQDVEIDRFLKAQSDRLRQNILDKVQAAQLQTLSVVEEKVLQKLREKEAEVESINKKNMELEERMDQLSLEARIWQHEARNNEHMITALKVNLDQVIAQSRDSKEGCGDSEIDDTASCCNGHSINFNMFGKESNDVKEVMTCKACRVNEVCMLLLPCKHLCLCKDCECKLSICPVCQSSKFIGMEVYY
ncbi:probable BOI-related E3 ubiquitin-protein ligase 2 [Rosa rugosa]|uniref:probable BOI-related E3 ubiquitin-protein ligase 2 n=1 Tax=Rosa rugosa TaxID=74645 RepID=UPI002B403279|nr:probable BOI-related E3 ubiquitin-protein ligase 2 [Rosa rugosa]